MCAHLHSIVGHGRKGIAQNDCGSLILLLYNNIEVWVILTGKATERESCFILLRKYFFSTVSCLETVELLELGSVSELEETRQRVERNLANVIGLKAKQ